MRIGRIAAEIFRMNMAGNVLAIRWWLPLALFAGLLGLGAAVVVLGPHLIAQSTDGPIANPTDFRAFYCGGWVVRAGADPYLARPLMDCEQAALANFNLHMVANFVLPAPLPPYALAAFAVLAFMPFPLASIVWFVANIALLAVTVILVVRLTGLRSVFVAAALLASDGYASLVIGQVVPVLVFSLCASALAARAGRLWLATALVGVAMIEPHVALPAALALFALLPQMRARLALLACTLSAVSIAAVGLPTCLEYVTSVLPAHARSEVAGFGAQYSLTSLLYAFGVGERIAVLLGESFYVVIVVVGIIIAREIACARRDDAYIVLVPPACALLGGVFVHIHQMAAAVPLALMLATLCTTRRQVVAIVALVCLAIPWESIAETPVVVGLYDRHHGYTSPVLPAIELRALAEEPEAAYMRAGGSYYDGRSVTEMIFWKLPTWLALAAIVGLAATASKRSRLVIQSTQA